jgi:hypothetical protein
MDAVDGLTECGQPAASGLESLQVAGTMLGER